MSAVMEMNINMYCGMRNAERCSAVPVPEYTWVKNTCKQEKVNGIPLEAKNIVNLGSCRWETRKKSENEGQHGVI